MQSLPHLYPSTAHETTVTHAGNGYARVADSASYHSSSFFWSASRECFATVSCETAFCASRRDCVPTAWHCSPCNTLDFHWISMMVAGRTTRRMVLTGVADLGRPPSPGGLAHDGPRTRAGARVGLCRAVRARKWSLAVRRAMSRMHERSVDRVDSCEAGHAAILRHVCLSR